MSSMFGKKGEFHVGPEVVGHFLEGLADNIVVALPSTCVQELGLTPNINDKQRPKELWIGRLRQLTHILRSEVLKAATEPQEVRRTLLQSAAQSVESRQPTEVKMNMQLAELTDDELVQMAHAATVIQKHWRRTQVMVANSMSVLEKFQNCVVKGFVIVECGSAGIIGDSLRYMRMLAGMGYMVLAPDDMAKKSPLRHRASKNMIRPEDPTDYWQSNLLYTDDKAAGEMVYSSTTENFLKNPDRFDQLYNNIITLRQAGLSFMMRRLPGFIKRHGVFLLGMSEGAIVLASFNDDMFGDFLRGRILCSYSCELNYWNYNRPEDIGINGRPDVPTLNMMGFEDEYFGSHNSIAATIAQYAGLPSVQGHAFDSMVQKNIEFGLVTHFEGGRHALCLTHDDVIRELLSDFLERPQYACKNLPSIWARFKDLQDLITRTRRSIKQEVLYLRILPPGQNSPSMSLANNVNVTQLLSKINMELYRLDCMSDDTCEVGEYADFHECSEFGGISPKSSSQLGNTEDVVILCKKARLLAHTLSQSNDKLPATDDQGGVLDTGEISIHSNHIAKEVTFDPASVVQQSNLQNSGLRNLRISHSLNSGIDRLASNISTFNTFPFSQSATQDEQPCQDSAKPQPIRCSFQHSYPSLQQLSQYQRPGQLPPSYDLSDQGYDQSLHTSLYRQNHMQQCCNQQQIDTYQQQVLCAQRGAEILSDLQGEFLEVIRLQSKSIAWLSGAVISLSVASAVGIVAYVCTVVLKSTQK